MNALRRYGEIYGLMLRNSVIREMNFKANFLLWLVVELLWCAVQLAAIEVLYGYVDEIGGWSKWQVVLLVGTHQLTSQFFQAFCFNNLSNVSELVRTGRLDFMLLLPVDSQFMVSLRQFSLDSMVNALVSVGIIGFALHKLGHQPGLAQIGLFTCGVLAATLVHYAIMCGLATASFWIVKAQGLIYGYYNIFNIARYPSRIFKGVFGFVFRWVFPVLVVANVPAGILAGLFKQPLWPMAHLLAVSTLSFLAARIFWKLAVRRYASASS